MKNWARYLCPSYIGMGYGNWCGAKRTSKEWHDKEPIDDGDFACRIHDFSLRNATQAEKKMADKELARAWREFKPNTWYGKMYRKALLLIFK